MIVVINPCMYLLLKTSRAFAPVHELLLGYLEIKLFFGFWSRKRKAESPYIKSHNRYFYLDKVKQ